MMEHQPSVVAGMRLSLVARVASCSLNHRLHAPRHRRRQAIKEARTRPQPLPFGLQAPPQLIGRHPHVVDAVIGQLLR